MQQQKRHSLYGGALVLLIKFHINYNIGENACKVRTLQNIIYEVLLSPIQLLHL